MRRLFLACLPVFLLSLFILFFVRVAPAAPAASLSARIQKALAASGQWADTAVAIHVRRLSDNATLYAHHAGSPMILASVTKLATTATALDRLGPDYRLETILAAVGRVQDGVVHGDLVLRGEGDPFLSGRLYQDRPNAVFEHWARELYAQGIRRVTGNLLADSTAFDNRYIHPDWPSDELHKWYCAPVAALSLNDNCLDVKVEPGAKAGRPAHVRWLPATAYLALDNQLLTTAARSEDAVSLWRAPESKTVVVKGRCAAGTGSRTFWVTVPDPPAFAVTVLAETLAGAGIQVDGTLQVLNRPPDRGGWITLARHTNPLSTALPVVNKKSQNLFAELLCKRLGTLSGGQGTWEAGTAEVLAFLGRQGLPREGLSFVDGSGLSRANRAPAQAITQLLAVMRNHACAQVYLDSLSIGATDGTLADRFRGVPGANRVRGKTGHLDGVSNLAGYVLNEQGVPVLAFAVLVNGGGGSARNLQDTVARILVEETR